MSNEVIALIIMAVMLILFLFQVFPLSVTAMLGAFAMAVFGLTDLNRILAQFGTSNVFCVLGMMVVGGTLFETGLAVRLGSFILGKHKNNEKVFIIILIITVTAFSSFLSNTTTTAMFMPVTAGIAASSEGKITIKNTYMLIGFSATLGGCMTLMGSPTQHLLAQDLIAAYGFEPMSFFYGARGTLVIMAVMILYFVLIGNRIQSRTLARIDETDRIDNYVKPQSAENVSIYKMIMSGVILVTTVALIALKVFSSGGGALVGAVACVVLGCIDLEGAFRKINWSVVMLLGALFAAAEAFNESGAGKLCVDAVFSVFGEDVSPYFLYALLVFTAMVLTNIIDNIAAQALIGPIAAAVAVRTGLNLSSVVFSILMACNIAYATPISTPCITMTLDGGYKFSDYLKIGGPLSLIVYVFTIALLPLLYGL